VRIIRNETYVKQAGKWYYVLGQGSRVQTEEELAAWQATASVPAK